MMFISESNCIFTNLAIEQKLLMKVEKDQKILFIYQNSPCTVMGRFQNPWQEMNLPYLFENKIPLARRQSGGGCVFHDLGNLNISFIQGTREHQSDINNKIVLEALKNIDVNAYLSQRSDIMVDYRGAKKISGSAFKQKKDRSIHHATLLINSNLDTLRQSLKSPFKIVKSKSTASNPNSVVNLEELNPNLSKDKMIKNLHSSFSDYLGNIFETEYLNEKDADKLYLQELKNPDWIFGETPEFIISLENGAIELDLTIKKGKITKSNLDWREYPLYQSSVDEVLEKYNSIYHKGQLELIYEFLNEKFGSDKIALDKMIKFLKTSQLY